MIRHLVREQFVPGEPAKIWAFFASPRNLNTLTPPNLKFRIMGKVSAHMYPGQMIEYRISFLPGLWTTWLTEITHVNEGEFFVDEQRIGPYRLWHHEHYFLPVPGGYLMTDHVTYDPGWGVLGRLAHGLWIEKELKRIFDFRASKITELFGGRAPETQSVSS